MALVRFFARAVDDARRDVFCPCSLPVAVAWVLWNWRVVRASYRE